MGELLEELREHGEPLTNCGMTRSYNYYLTGAMPSVETLKTIAADRNAVRYLSTEVITNGRDNESH